ncbi:MAG: hypothetical protein M3Z75_17185 [Actinomycetota bacterium]|nr:hypothetical protein [Actinomycetota bacterium]
MDSRLRWQGIRQLAELLALDQAEDQSSIGGLLARRLGAGDTIFDRAVVR